MPDVGLPAIDDRAVLAARPARNHVDPRRPYAFLVERERTAAGLVEPVATVFLTNRECPFRCVFCDLWKNTTEDSVAIGAIPAQIDHALANLPAARHIKLYNSGNFFDTRAISPKDHPPIALRVRSFDSVIVENHPLLCTNACTRFHNLVETRLEVAMGLETIHPAVLPRLNKRMTVKDFDRATEFLLKHDIAVRAFVLLQPPFLSTDAAVEWAVRTVEHAFSIGVGCCSIIPTRGGNGVMEQLASIGHFTPPTLRAMEEALDQSIALQSGRVFMDLWDIERFCACPRCGPARVERLRATNLSQQILPRIRCDCEALP